jgi:hypothetical protein
MKTTKPLLLIIFMVLFLVGCATPANKMNLISVGMTKAEVIEILGIPVSTAATENTEYLRYWLPETNLAVAVLFSSDDASVKPDWSYFVRIINGKVNAYGRLGDFDSTKIPEDKTTIDLNINRR